MSASSQSSSSEDLSTVTAPAIPHLKAGSAHRHDGTHHNQHHPSTPTTTVTSSECFPSLFVAGCTNQIAKGSFGVVYEVGIASDDDGTVHRYAAKCISLSNISQRALHRIVREVEMLSHFQFSCQVVRVIDVFQHADPSWGDRYRTLWIVMDLMPLTLFDFYPRYSENNDPLDLPRFRYVMCQVLLALAIMHKQGCCHRDLSPRNILLSECMTTVLADFGLARFLAEGESYSPDVVTILYKAPEVALGCKHYSTAVDMWAVGVLIAEFMLQEHLFPMAQRVPSTMDMQLLKSIFQTVGAPCGAEMAQEPFASMPDLAKEFVARFQTSPTTIAAHNQSNAGSLETRLKASVGQYHVDYEEDAHCAVHLIGQLLRIDPSRRPTAEEALLHPFFDCYRDYIEVESIHHTTELNKLIAATPAGSQRGDVVFTRTGATATALRERLEALAPLRV